MSFYLDKDLHNMVAYGGIDALVWVCRTSKNLTLHNPTTTVLAILAEKGMHAYIMIQFIHFLG